MSGLCLSSGTAHSGCSSSASHSPTQLRLHVRHPQTQVTQPAPFQHTQKVPLAHSSLIGGRLADRLRDLSRLTQLSQFRCPYLLLLVSGASVWPWPCAGCVAVVLYPGQNVQLCVAAGSTCRGYVPHMWQGAHMGRRCVVACGPHETVLMPSPAPAPSFNILLQAAYHSSSVSPPALTTCDPTHSLPWSSFLHARP